VRQISALLAQSHDPFTFLAHAREGRIAGPNLPGNTAMGLGDLISHRLLITMTALAALLVIGQARAADDDTPKAEQTGASGLGLPRFVSLKSDKVNVRKGPNTDQAIVWVFNRAGLPVEVIAESENWRRVRDSEGADGWVLHSLLSGRRTVLIAPWSKDQESVPLYSSKSIARSVAAALAPGVLGNVLNCDGEWCQISVDDYSGYVEQDKLWGVYKGEEIK
jgi:SH3-like domain-containing protein